LIKAQLDKEGSEASTKDYLDRANVSLNRLITNLWRSGIHLPQPYFQYLLEYAELKLTRYEFYKGVGRFSGVDVNLDWIDAVDHATFLIDLVERYQQPLLKAEAGRVLAEAVIKATDETVSESSRPPGLDAVRATAMKCMDEAIRLFAHYPKRCLQMEVLAKELKETMQS
jgi:hypothetical protein